jgi:hypothetical protein
LGASEEIKQTIDWQFDTLPKGFQPKVTDAAASLNCAISQVMI